MKFPKHPRRWLIVGGGALVAILIAVALV